MPSAKDIPHLYVEKRLGNIGLLLAVSLCYCYIARNGGCVFRLRDTAKLVCHAEVTLFSDTEQVGICTSH